MSLYATNCHYVICAKVLSQFVLELIKMARLGYTNEDFLNLIMIYAECNRIIDRTCRTFAARYPEKSIPDKKTVKAVLSNCLTYGSFRPTIQRSRPLVDNEEHEINILGYFTAHPNASLRDAETDMRIPFKTIHRILKKHKWKPFCYTQVQHLKPEDLPLRVEFCEWLLIKNQEDPDFAKHIIWSDEAKFSKNGIFNRHNTHFWSDENPNLIRERCFQNSWQFNVFCAIKDNRIFCLYFYEENLTGDRYCNILRNGILPALHHLPEYERDNVWYQQDGAPPHNTASVGHLLQKTFYDKWIANNGPFHWPARSPDLTPLDYFIWGYVKNRVYADPVTTKEDMQNRIREAFNNLNGPTIRNATHNNLIKRAQMCINENGGIFEHLLK